MPPTNKIAFSEMPVEAKAALVLMPLAWLTFAVGQAVFMGALSVVQLGMGGLCCVLVFGQKNWGRWFCGAYNVVLMASLFYQGPAAFGGVWFTSLLASLFALCTVALLLPGTARCFRLASQRA